MRLLHICVALLCLNAASGFSQYQPGVNNNLTLLGHLHQYQEYSNIWGYTDPQGREYALLGTDIGLSIVNITDPRHPLEVAFVPGPGPTAWREIKTYQNVAYVVSEATFPNQYSGIQVVDLSSLPDTVGFFYSVLWPGVTQADARAHTVSVDGAGYLYIQGGTATAGTGGVNGGIRIFSLADALLPLSVGYYNPRYVHDAFIHKNRLFNSNINDGGHVDVLDLADRRQPNLLTQLAYPRGFSHNSGITEDDNYLITTDEMPGYTVKFWDIRVLWDNDPSNDDNIELVAEYIGDPKQIAHNVHVRGQYAYLSHYLEGVKVLDISNPRDPVEVAYYDTYPDPGEGFAGDWGVYPYFPSGTIVVSDMQTGLYVFKFDTVKAGGVQGKVTNQETAAVLAGVTLRFVEANKSLLSNAAGEYRLRTNQGRHTIIASALGFFPDTLQVDLPAGAGNQQLDFSLRPENAFLAIDIDSVKAVLPANSVADREFSLRNPAPGTLRFSIRDINGPARRTSAALLPPALGGRLARLTQNKPPVVVAAQSDAVANRVQQLETIITDPSGDQFGGQQPDLVSVAVEKGAEAIAIKMKFAHPVDGDSLLASLSLDADQNPETGDPAIGIFLNDLGPEFDVLLSVPAFPAVGVPAASVLIFGNGGSQLLIHPDAVLVGPDSSISATILLSDLGNDDGNINVVAGAYHFGRTINNSPTSFDVAPNEGHGTIGFDANADAPWLSEAPASGSIAGVGSQTITLTFNTNSLETGSYSALLIINTNDPNQAERMLPVKLQVTPSVGVEEEPVVPSEFALRQNQPNPFYADTHIGYALPGPADVELKIYDVQGRFITTLISGQQAPGRHTVHWNGRDQRGALVANGVYFYVMKAGGRQITRKLLIAR
jgi:choice-of-anchor B domain-containing protein